MEVLITFICKKRLEQDLVTESEMKYGKDAAKISTDIQAALKVIGRRKLPFKIIDSRKIVLYEANLRDANLEKLCFEGAVINCCNLTEALLNEGNFRKVEFIDTDFTEVVASGADFTKARFIGARLEKGVFFDAKFTSASVSFSDLQNALFHGADFTGAKLNGSDIAGASFIGAKGLTVDQIKAAQNYEQAKYDSWFCKELGIPITD
jgi:uncharacterized protein YjbI with pentapeptide repeats